MARKAGTESSLRISVSNLDEVRRGLRKAGDGLDKDLGKAGKAAADIVAQAAKAKVPVVTGRAKSTLRAAVVRGGGGVRFGGAKAPYAAWLDYGGRVGRNKSVVRPFKREGRIVYPTLAERRQEVIEKYEELVKDVLRRANLK